MKVAISGKGGVGKTTLAGVMSRILADRGFKVLSIDADPDSNLASAIGIEPAKLKDVQPLAQMKEFIEERTGSKRGAYGSFFKMNPKVDDIPEKFSIAKDGVRLLILGTIPQGGGGCFCGENVLLKSLLSHLFVERDEYVVVDMEAGLEHLGRGTTAYMDALIVVVEPGQRSMQTARQVKSLADDLGVRRVYIVGNKVTGEPDAAMIKEHLASLPFLGYISQNEKILEADKLGVSPYDLDERIRSEVSSIIEALSQHMTKT
ncbi:MAG TPA: carbon monoxide dehydrogenase accessory protein CooC [Syntrophorhabdales bacterium]|nr:carbon monoxide dehydrogenase accessory protein CooC [Syntrophorhabdales bacterium]